MFTQGNEKKILWISLSAIVVSILTLIIFFLGGNRSGVVENKRQWVNPASKEELEESLKTMTRMRTIWEKWASDNRHTIISLLNSDDNDFSKVESLINKLPETQGAIFSSNFIGYDFGWKDLNRVRKGPNDKQSEFSSCVLIDKIPAPKDKDQAAVYFTGKEKAKESRLKDFKDYHDLAIVRSNNNGPKHYTLFVSGRIVEERPDLDGTNQRKEVLGVYDFLK